MVKKLKRSKVNHKTIVQPYDPLQYKEHYFNWSINCCYLDLNNKEFELFKNRDQFFSIIKKLDSFRSWRCSKIESSRNDTSCGVMDINKLNTKEMVQGHLLSINKDVDQLYKMEINNHHRIWGIREKDCLFLIWDDCNHSFYKQKNKNYTPKKEER